MAKAGRKKRVDPVAATTIAPELAARLAKEDIKSLEAAKAHSFQYNSARASVQTRLSPQGEASLRMAGLSDWELELCHEWAGLSTAPGISEECRYAKHVLDKMPLPPGPDILNPGVLDKQQFWDQMGLAERLDFFWDASHFQEHSPEPKTVLGQIALKVIHHWREFAEANWPTAADIYWALKRKETQGTKRRRPKLEAETKVGLASIWRLVVHLERVWHGRKHRSSINPEDIYEALGDLQGQVAVDCWARDDETMLELLKKHPGALPGGCSYCDVYSLDTFEWGWGGNSTTCPRCSGRMMAEFFGNKKAEQPPAWDGGPTPPERGDFAYRWAVKHGMMWDEFLKKVRGLPIVFDPAKKVLCPLLELCDTRCAQDQKAGVRSWPLGTSDYETSCHKFREIAWCRDTGGTPEQFEAVEHARLEEQLNKAKKARGKRQPKKAGAPSASGGPPAPSRPPSGRAAKVAPPTPGVERPRLF